MRASLVAILLLVGCSDSGGVTALHDLHQPKTPVTVPGLTDDFYALPHPNDLRVEADGTLDMSRYPRVGGIIDEFLAEFDHIRGAGTNAGIYFRFDGAIDPTTLPADAHASVAEGATAFVVDVTPASPTFGKKTPVRVHYVPQSYDFIGPYWLTLLPFPGIPLHEKTTYAAILTDGIRAADGTTIHRAGDLGEALRSPPAPYKPLTDWLAAQPGLADHLINATVFTTGDFTSVMFKLRQAVYDQAPAPLLVGLSHSGGDANLDDQYEGTYAGPNFQSGTVPYMGSGGSIVYAADGTPMMDHVENLRVAMSVPLGPMPAAGWPVVIYAHGTGGDYQSFLSDGSGASAAERGLAMISIDQVLHGTRVPDGTNIELAFFNFLNLPAFRDNLKQGALDDFQLLRLVKSIDVAAAPTTGAPIKFDPGKIYFKGHSQGGLTGPLFVAAEPEVKAAVMSGAGGVIIYALLNKTEPVDVVAGVRALFHDDVDEFHPVLNLAQNYAEESDPVNYAKLFFREPPAGFAAKPIYQSLGLIDHYTPIPVIKALALAMGVQPIAPQLEPIDGLDLAGLSWGTAPTQGNVAGGAATGVLLEYTAPAKSDGHFVVFDVPAAIKQSNQFLATHATTGTASLVAP